jgi:hypothetical protein
MSGYGSARPVFWADFLARYGRGMTGMCNCAQPDWADWKMIAIGFIFNLIGENHVDSRMDVPSRRMKEGSQ